MPVKFDEPSATSGRVVFDEPPAVSPYSLEGLAELGQRAIQSRARAMQLRDEAEAELARPKYFVGIRPNLGGIGLPQVGMDRPLVQFQVPEALVAFGSEAVKSSPSVAAGTAAASAAFPAAQRAGSAISALPVPLAPVVGTGVRLLAPVVAGGAAAVGTRLAQEAVLPEILPEGLARSYEESAVAAARSPTASMLGQFAGAGPFFRPGLPIGTTGGARVAVPAITGGISGGIEGAQQIAEGEFDPQRLALAAAGGALLNRETALGRRIGPNLVLPQAQTDMLPAELIPVGQAMRESLRVPEPSLPSPTMIVPSELAPVAAARAEAGAEIAASAAQRAALESAESQARIRALGERMMGKTPQDQLQILDQEMRLQKDYLNEAEQRAGLDLKQELKRQIDAQKAMEEVATAQAKAAADQEKAVADAQKAIEAAQQPPEMPESARILAEPITKTPSIANVATEVATQTKNSPYALQERLNQMTTPAAAEVAGGVPPIEAAVSPQKTQAIQQAVANPLTKWQYTVFRPGEGYPSAIQVDAIEGTANTVSSNVADLNAAGANLPEVPDWVPQGQYSVEEIRAFIKQGEPKNAIREQEATGGVLRAEAQQPELDVGLQGMVRQNGPETPARDLVRQGPVQEPRSAEQRLNDAGIGLPPISSLSAKQKLAELQAGGVTAYKGKPIEDANPAQLSAALGQYRRGQLGSERGNIPTNVLAPIGGAAGGATTGFVSTERQPGETDEQYQARRIRNIIIGAGLGGTGGVGLNSISAASRRRTPPKAGTVSKSGDVALPTVESGEGIRQTAEKVILNKSYPEQLRTTLAEDPQIVYDKISQNQIRDLTMGATDAELVQMLASPDPNLRIGALIEQGNRASVTPGMEAEGARILSEVAKNFTAPAQLLGLGKLVRSPDAFVKAIEDTLANVGAGKGMKQVKRMNDAVRKRLYELSKRNIAAEQRLAKAERAATQDFSDANVRELNAAQREVGDSALALDKYVKDIVPEDYGQIFSKVIKGNLLAPLSFAKNMFGNAAWQTMLRGTESIATALDAVYSRTRGKPRTMMLGSPLPSGPELQAFADGVRIASKEMLTGPSAESYVKYEIQRGFHPVRAMIQAFSGLPAAERLMAAKDIASLPTDAQGRVATADRVKKLIEGVFGVAPEVSFRLLSLGDKPVRSAAEARILNEQANLRGLTGRQREQFMRLPDEETKALLAKEGPEAILAQENQLALNFGRTLDTALTNTLKALRLPTNQAVRDVSKILGTLVVPFRAFPANFASVAVNFAVPPVAFTRALVEGARGNRRDALRSYAEGLIGMMLYSAAHYLWENGLISEPMDKRDKKRRSAQYEAMGGQRLNLSGLERLRNGGDPTYRRGDDTRDWSSLGIPAATFYVYTSRRAKDEAKAARTGDEPVKRPEIEALFDLAGATGFAFDQSFLSGTSAAIDALQDWDNFGDKFIQNTFRAITSIPVPNTVEALAKTQYPFIPELKGDTLKETLGNVWEYKTFQLTQDERANYKRDMWGTPVSRTPEGQNPYLAQFLDVTKAETKQPDRMKQVLLNLYQQTNSTDVYPPLVTNRVSNQGTTVTLKDDDYDDLQELVGRYREQYARRLADDPRFSDMSILPEQKIIALQRAYSLGTKLGQNELFRRPGFAQKYPELFGQPLPPGQESSVLSRDVKARAREKIRRGVVFDDE